MGSSSGLSIRRRFLNQKLALVDGRLHEGGFESRGGVTGGLECSAVLLCLWGKWNLLTVLRSLTFPDLVLSPFTSSFRKTRVILGEEDFLYISNSEAFSVCGLLGVQRSVIASCCQVACIYKWKYSRAFPHFHS